MKPPVSIPGFNVLTNKRFCSQIVLTAIVFLCGTLFFFRNSLCINATNDDEVFKADLSISNQTTEPTSCQNQSKLLACEALPKGIITSTTNLKMQHLWKSPSAEKKKVNNVPLKALLAMAVGIGQKEAVDQIVKKFSSIDSMIMLFHYDGFVNGWRDLQWVDKALHISAINQTKWWFAKRFLHPDVVVEYDYIFLWDEDLELDHFNPKCYLEIVKKEGLEVSQPLLDLSKSEVHHLITVRESKGNFHRRIFLSTRVMECDESSIGPPCMGWVEIMAPVFSKAAWRCTWHLIQNDLIHAWGLDYKLRYCAQGDISTNVGIVDREYIVHRGIPPTLGVSDDIKLIAGAPTGSPVTQVSPANADRVNVRLRAYAELDMFLKRWKAAASEDICWKDIYRQKTVH